MKEVNPIANYIPFTEEQREQARQTDLVAFLRQCGEIVKPSGSEFQWNNDGQKITIRGNVWYNQYEQFGGDVMIYPAMLPVLSISAPAKNWSLMYMSRIRSSLEK